MRVRVPAGTRLAAGAVLVLIALCCLGAARVLSSTQRHAYDPHATPAPTYRVTAGKLYQLSSSQGVSKLTSSGVLGNGIAVHCVISGASGAQTPLTIESTKDDSRDLHVFATFRAARSGSFHFRCDGIGDVFVDDADDSPPDFSAGLTVLASLLAAVGVTALLSGAYAVSEDRRSPLSDV
ncbi:MAG: hypothetical protein QOK10_2876 [Pseudonocardiales bacterium]|jgi:hypothetical protein|nr:hypothetical protein [Pseudonocardiales bacterium]